MASRLPPCRGAPYRSDRPSLRYRVFHYDDDRDHQVAADGAVERSLEEILALMGEVLRSPGSFVGVMAEDGSLMTFVVVEEGIQLDVPQPKRRGSYFKVTDLAECTRVLQQAAGQFDHAEVEGLTWERW